MDKVTKLTVMTVPELWGRRGALFKDTSADLASVEDIDSAGIALLVKWSKSIPDGKLKLKNVSEDALSLLETYNVKDLFEIS